MYHPDQTDKYIDPRLKLPNSNVNSLLESCLNSKLLKEPFEEEALVQEEFPSFFRNMEEPALTQYTPTFQMHQERIASQRSH